MPMRLWWSVLVLCAGCLQPNPAFVVDATDSASETASAGESGADADTTAPTATATDPSTTNEQSASATTAVETTSATSEGEDATSGATSTGGVADSHTIFVSSADIGGDFGSLAVADDFCTELANGARLGGSWRAVLSDSTAHARDRITISGPIRNTMGELIAESSGDLWDGFIAAPIRYTELGDEFLASPFTGTLADGTAGANCNDWTAGGGASGVVGDAGYASEVWIDSGSGNCGQSAPFYCISQ
jgi:hypothetical protein